MIRANRFLTAGTAAYAAVMIAAGFLYSPVAHAGNIYACKSGNNVWSCSAGNKSDCSDVTDGSGTSYCATGATCTQIDSSLCGKDAGNAGSPGGNAGSPGGNAGSPGGTGTPGGNTTSGGDIDCKKDPNACLYNPLPTPALKDMFLIIARGFLYMTGVIAVVFIIIGGFRMVLAQGNEEAYGAAKKTVTWAILGLVLALLSFSIIAIVQSLLGASLPLVP